MMEAKDTVMKLSKVDILLMEGKTTFRVAQIQAEISFEAGRKVAADEYEKFIQATVIPDSKKVGRREVVKWAGVYSKAYDMRIDGFVVPWVDWQAKLKEWGIDGQA